MRSLSGTRSWPACILILSLAALPAAALEEEADRFTGRSFDASHLDRKRWRISEDLYEKIAARLEMGKHFFLSKDRGTFLEKLGDCGAGEESPIDIGWIIPSEKRYLGTLLSRTRRDLVEMSDAEFERYRRDWKVESEIEHRRFTPLPGEVRGYGTKERRAELLRTTRDLIRAGSRDAFIEKVKDRIEGGSLSILFVPKGGQGPTWYAFPANEVEALTESRFQTWRRRFLRWIEIHTPGQSLVKKFADASVEEFEAMYAASKDKHGAFDIKRALDRFEKRAGIRLTYPEFASKRTAPIVESILDGSPAAASGIEPGDRILKVEGAAVPEWNDFIYLAGGFRPGSVLKLTVLARGTGKEMDRYLRIM